MPVMKLSNEVLEQFRLTDGAKRAELADEVVKGFTANVFARRPGEGDFKLKYKSENRTSRKSIGVFPSMSVDQARSIAIQLKEELKTGSSLSSYIGTATNPPTLQEYIQDSWLPTLIQRVRPNTYKMYSSLARLHIIPAMGNRHLEMVRSNDILKLVTSIRQQGLSAATANRALATIRALYNSAIAAELVEKNPASKVTLYKEPLKERYLSASETRDILYVLETDDNQATCRVFRFALFTGARINEVLQSTADMIDVANQSWTIPAANSKSGRSRTIPLNERAMEVIGEIDLNHSSGSLFIGRTGQPLRHVHKVWGRLRKKAGLSDFTIHSLRHSFSAFYLNSGENRSIYELKTLLGHANVRTTERYSHLQASTLRSPTSLVSAAIDKALSSTA
jgi:integrase